MPPPACIMRSIARSASTIELVCAYGPYRCECVSLSGSDSSMKSNRSFSTMCAATQPEWRSRWPGIPSVERQSVLRDANRSA